MLRQKQDEDKITTVIGPGARLEGSLEARGIIRLDGNLQGKIITKGEVIIGEEGKANADIEAGTLTIAGTVIGNVQVKERLEIKSGGTLQGDLHAKKVVMEEGAAFDGKCSMSTDKTLPDKKLKS